jgi:hypothetical protein
MKRVVNDGLDRGGTGELRERARRGDKTALYLLVRLLRGRGDRAAAVQAVADIGLTDT